MPGRGRRFLSAWPSFDVEQRTDGLGNLPVRCGFIIFWVLLGESLVIFLPERIYAMHLRDAEARPKPMEADPGKVIIKMTEQEAAEMQDALAHYAKLREGHLKAVRPISARAGRTQSGSKLTNTWKSAPLRS
jgi:hypothetical protein